MPRVQWSFMKNRRAIKIVGSFALCSLSMFGCSSNTQTPNSSLSEKPPGPPPIGQPLKKPSGPPLKLKKLDNRVVKASNEFGFDALRHMNATGSNANVLISPLSLSSALTMTYNGASGATQNEMERTLRLGTLQLQEVNAAHAALRYNLATAIPHNDPRLELKIANSLWAQKGVAFNAEFLVRGKQSFGAKISSLDLGDPEAIEQINGWVSQETSGKIKKIYDEPPASQPSMILLNAMYFNGQWQDQFDENDTKDAPFYLQGGLKKQVPMMSREGYYPYGKIGNFTAIEMPYGEGNLNLLLLLPNKGIPLDSLIAGLSQAKLDKYREQMESQEGTISIPRFKINSESDYVETLQEMGMKSAFSSNADFTKMRSQNDLFISEVRQKAVFEVNERGTESAVTTWAALPKSAPEDPFDFKADHPFVGILYEKDSGTVLFMVAVREP